MQFHILKRDIKRNKAIVITLFSFMVMAAFLVSGAISIITALSGSMEGLLKNTDSAHFAQLHAGTVEPEQIAAFAADHSRIIKDYQIVELLNINGNNLFVNQDISEADSIMENSFVRQNESFDFLVDLDNRVVRLSPGEVAVPIYHMKKYNLAIGDNIRVAGSSFTQEFVIVAFVRDCLMNPSIINSKRFLVSDSDWEHLSGNLGKIESMIEFQARSPEAAAEIEALYRASGLPQKGSVMSFSLVKLINSMSDGITASVIILIAGLLIVISMLCLRFSILSTIQEDYREIGIMKALGLPEVKIRQLYMTKYLLISGLACCLGCLLSFLLRSVFLSDISLYMGKTEITPFTTLLPVSGALAICLTVAVFCRVILRCFSSIPAAEAMRSQSVRGDGLKPHFISLARCPVGNINIFLGVRDVLQKIKSYSLLCIVYAVCTFIMTVPYNLLHTISSPAFVAYMGAGQCDLRIDLQHSGDIRERYEDMMKYLKQDVNVEKYTAFYTCRFPVAAADGTSRVISAEIGDFTVFPLPYSCGRAPETEYEIALSAMNAEELGKQIGDTMTVIAGNEEMDLTVCGIYQDVTKGGKTAKAMLPFELSDVDWLTVNLDLQAGVSPAVKIREYADAFYPARITDVTEYLYQTLGNIIDQLQLVTGVSFAMGMIVAILITAMFFQMLLAKEMQQIRIMQSLGFTISQIRCQYIARAFLVLLLGVVAGSAASALLGGTLAGFVISGVSNMKLTISPLTNFILFPGLLLAAVTAAVMICGKTLNKHGSLCAIAE